MVYNNCRVYGPYTRKDNRKHICLIYPDGKKTTVSYPKYLVEKHLNKYLEENETIHHINGDFNDNRLENLKVIERSKHCKLHAHDRTHKDETHECYYCGKQFVVKGSKLRNRSLVRKNRKSVGFFCSKSCCGKYGAEVQKRMKKCCCGEIGSTRRS